MANLTKDFEETHSRNASILSSGPEEVLLLYSEWANESWTTTLHATIAQLRQPHVLKNCGFVLVPAEAADIAVAQACRLATAPQTHVRINQAAVDDEMARKSLFLAACLLRHRCWSMIWHSEAASCRSFVWARHAALRNSLLACKPL